MTFKKLFEPCRIGKLEIKNRIIQSPLCTNLANRDGSVSQKLIEYYRERARGGTGLIIVEFCYTDNKASQSRECQLGVYDNTFIPGLGLLADTIKHNGAKAGLQLAHCGRQRFLKRPPMVAPSCIPWEELCDLIPEELTIEEIREIVESFGQSAKRAKMAGFDLVEIHGGHGYLITEFLSPATNKRNDIYGGDIFCRMRFLIEIVRCVREYVGEGYPLSVRLSASEYMEKGITLEETKVVAKELEKEKVDILHISGGNHETRWAQVVPMFLPLAIHVPAAAEIKKEVKIPIIASGSITSPELAEEILLAGKADFVGLARPLLADPYFAKKALEGNTEDIRRCIRCNEGCLKRGPVLSRSVSCAVNPVVGHEDEYRLTLSLSRKRIAVIGGGPAGMEAARVAALKGHDVTLYEKGNKLGGRLYEASIPGFKKDIESLIYHLSIQMKKLKVKMIFKEANAAEIKKGKFDAVIVATGAEPICLRVPGIDKKCVLNVLDVLRGKNPGRDITVIGGGMIGAETALYLAEMGKKVRIVEMLDDIAMDVESATRKVLMQRLKEAKVEIITGKRLSEIKDNKIILADSLGRETEISTKAVIMAAGMRPERKLYEELKNIGICLYVVGDCVEPRKIMDAIHEGFFAAFSL